MSKLIHLSTSLYYLTTHNGSINWFISTFLYPDNPSGEILLILIIYGFLKGSRKLRPTGQSPHPGQHSIGERQRRRLFRVQRRFPPVHRGATGYPSASKFFEDSGRIDGAKSVAVSSHLQGDASITSQAAPVGRSNHHRRQRRRNGKGGTFARRLQTI